MQMEKNQRKINFHIVGAYFRKNLNLVTTSNSFVASLKAELILDLVLCCICSCIVIQNNKSFLRNLMGIYFHYNA